MQFGVFSVSDITRDPVSGYTPSEAERIDAVVQIAKKAEEVGMDVFAIGEHHNPPFFSSAPTTLLAYIAASVRAVASPMPLLAPVMRMTLGLDIMLSPCWLVAFAWEKSSRAGSFSWIHRPPRSLPDPPNVGAGALRDRRPTRIVPAP